MRRAICLAGVVLALVACGGADGPSPDAALAAFGGPCTAAGDCRPGLSCSGERCLGSFTVPGIVNWGQSSRPPNEIHIGLYFREQYASVVLSGALRPGGALLTTLVPAPASYPAEFQLDQVAEGSYFALAYVLVGNGRAVLGSEDIKITERGAIVLWNGRIVGETIIEIAGELPVE